MNLYHLLSRLLAILYAGFFMLFAILEGITRYGARHLPAPVLVVIGLLLFWEKPGWSSLYFGVLFAISVWFYKTWTDVNLWLIVSLPLAVVVIFSLVAFYLKRKSAEPRV
jgi:hypothetical protein